ncbi:hypothetical protein [Pedobacter mendelii]|uniref:HRDC domain-containing protein n=1 Tax=Pedobacter mendelii TaxID=1908240 RepID=A0ABQ2BMA2_9SPHI|nr:hypothetical protein [Pedobacter mendelii]GGI27545.1 hypothetical protein GCM10008119_28190 [Pedobacter mendelii]
MENLNRKSDLSTFLQRVKQLRGFGDMNSYILVTEFKDIGNIPEHKIQNIIEDMSSPQTWNNGKSIFIETVLEKILEN